MSSLSLKNFFSEAWSEVMTSCHMTYVGADLPFDTGACKNRSSYLITVCMALESELCSVTCHMGSHNVTCHPTQAHTPRHNSSAYVLNLPTPDGWQVELT